MPERLRVAVVGHIEWVEFAVVPRVPLAGEVMHAGGTWEEPAGGGAVAAVQLARLAGGCELFTALGPDDLARRAEEGLTELGVRVHAARRLESTRRAFIFIDSAGERTITTLGPRLEPAARDPLPWERLSQMDAVYFTAGDANSLHAARAARVLVASPRARSALDAGVKLDALVLSAHDADERHEAERERTPANWLVLTDGGRGGAYTRPDGTGGRWTASPLPGARVDSYGCGDSFAAGFTFGLARYGGDVDAALALGARCGATCMTGRGPYGRQLTGAEL